MKKLTPPISAYLTGVILVYAAFSLGAAAVRGEKCNDEKLAVMDKMSTQLDEIYTDLFPSPYPRIECPDDPTNNAMTPCEIEKWHNEWCASWYPKGNCPPE
jgi:hypothetical protein